PRAAALQDLRGERAPRGCRARGCGDRRPRAPHEHALSAHGAEVLRRGGAPRGARRGRRHGRSEARDRARRERTPRSPPAPRPDLGPLRARPERGGSPMKRFLFVSALALAALRSAAAPLPLPDAPVLLVIPDPAAFDAALGGGFRAALTGEMSQDDPV